MYIQRSGGCRIELSARPPEVFPVLTLLFLAAFVIFQEGFNDFVEDAFQETHFAGAVYFEFALKLLCGLLSDLLILGSVGEVEAVGDLLDAEARRAQQEGDLHHEHLVNVVDDDVASFSINLNRKTIITS